VKLGAAELETLLMPIALYPDALLATLLPASVYPLEIVQAARFLQDSNNVSKIDEQPWDRSVKAIAKIPAVLKKMNDDLSWTIQLGEVFLNQDKDVMDAIQSLRLKAQKAGTLKTTEQQIVTVTNTVVETKVEQRVVVVTNTIVQIAPANPEVIYIPTYSPAVYYPAYYYPAPAYAYYPAYYYDPWVPFITFGAGVAIGAMIWNNCDWHHGGCHWGDVDVDVNRNFNQNINRGGNTINRGGNTINSGNRPSQQPNRGQKWQPDANRVRSKGSANSARTMESRGFGSGPSRAGGARASTLPSGGNRGGGAMASTRPSTPSAGNRPSNPSAGTRPSNPGAGNRPSSPSAGTRPSSPGAANRPSTPSAGTRPSTSSSSGSRSSGSSAFSGGGGAGRQFSDRGGSSRGGGGFSGGGGSRGGGGFSRGGGGRGGGRR
jgi:hypothetical protein